MSYSKLSSHIKSPVPFNKQPKRPPVNQGMQSCESRFVAFNSMPPIMTKYRKSPSPDFPKSKRGSFLQELERNQDNASN